MSIFPVSICMYYRSICCQQRAKEATGLPVNKVTGGCDLPWGY